MSRYATLVLLFGCTAGDWATAPRPTDYAPPPGANQLTLSGDAWVRSGWAASWAVTGPDLAVGDRVAIGWGLMEAPGRCPHSGLVGGWLCLDIDNGGAGGARYWTTSFAIDDPEAPGTVVAPFDLPALQAGSLDRVYLQAMKIAGDDSATTNVWPVDISQCQDTSGEPNDTQATAVAFPSPSGLTSCLPDEEDWFVLTVPIYCQRSVGLRYDGDEGTRRLSVYDADGNLVATHGGTPSSGSTSLGHSFPLAGGSDETYFLKVELVGDISFHYGAPYTWTSGTMSCI